MSQRMQTIRSAVLFVVLASGAAAKAQTSNSLNVEFFGNKNDHQGTTTTSYSACWGYTAPDGREYALLGTREGTSIIDITDAPTLREVVFIPGPVSAWREMKTFDGEMSRCTRRIARPCWTSCSGISRGSSSS